VINNTIVQIKISGLPAIFPQDYTGKINTFLRVIATGTYSEKVITDDAWRTIYDSNYQERKIQTVTYNKYKIRVMANEYLRADLIEFAKYGSVITQDNVTHKMRVLNVSYTKQDNTELGTYEIEYADVNPKNYKNQQIPINNYLEHNQIQNEFTTAQLQMVYYSYTVSGSTAIHGFYTELLFEDDIPEVKEEKQEANGIENPTRSIMTRTKKGRFYLNTADKNTLMGTLPWSTNAQFIGAGGTHDAVERILPEVQSVGIDLWQVNLTLKYLVSNYYPENS